MIRTALQKAVPAAAPDAPPDERDEAALAPLSQIALWGGIAALCLFAVAIASRTETGQARMAEAHAALTGTAEPVRKPSAERERQADELRRVSERLRLLGEDRDRLLVRIAALERNYDDVTGSIGKLSAAARPAAEAPAGPLTAGPIQASPPPAPVASAPATVAAAAASANPEPQDMPIPKGEFGVDLGGAASLASLRTAWDRLRRNHASHLGELQPVVAIREIRGGQIELRLVAGPIANAAAASRLCAALAASGLSCQPTVYEGQRLASR